MDEDSERKKQDFDDYNREVSGVNVARMDRFLIGSDNPRSPEVRQRKEREQSLRRQLDILMQNPAFAAAYYAANSAIDETQNKLNAAVSTTAANIERLSNIVRDMEDQTAKLPDGTAVFKTKDGTLKSADGRHLSEAETASLLNPENILEYDAYTAARDALNNARARQNRYGEIQEEFDDARDRLDKAETPEELKEIEKDMRETMKEIQTMNSSKPQFNISASKEIDPNSAKLNFGASSPQPEAADNIASPQQ